MTLQNRGKMPFTFQVLSPSSAAAHSPLPGVPLVLPSSVRMLVGGGEQKGLSLALCQAAWDGLRGESKVGKGKKKGKERKLPQN